MLFRSELEYEPFRTMVRAALNRVGGLRIDHIIGLFQLWWVPDGLGPSAGTYVRYNHEALIGILALEAYRAQALVVGEDLGTVEPWVREYLSRRGLLGTAILWWEYGTDGQVLPPEKWREYCMASVTTHDLPPTLGYLESGHVRLREQLGLLLEPVEQELAVAERERDMWVERLIAFGEECKKNVSGYPTTKYKSFPTKENVPSFISLQAAQHQLRNHRRAHERAVDRKSVV